MSGGGSQASVFCKGSPGNASVEQKFGNESDKELVVCVSVYLYLCVCVPSIYEYVGCQAKGHNIISTKIIEYFYSLKPLGPRGLQKPESIFVVRPKLKKYTF